jgi:Raf kinase inhibitor-like YbhB/YbcL family protein
MRVRNRTLNSPAIFGLLGLLAQALCAGCGSSGSLPPEEPSRMTIKLSSSAIADGALIPKTFTCDGSDRSPPLEWSGVPSSARSLALICDDPDAPMGTWSHWVVFNLPPQTNALSEAIPPTETFQLEVGEGRQGRNDFKKLGYGGPCPPGGTHRYYFRLYALDSELELTSKATRADVLKAIEGHIVAEGRLVGKYQRGSKE